MIIRQFLFIGFQKYSYLLPNWSWIQHPNILAILRWSFYFRLPSYCHIKKEFYFSLMKCVILRYLDIFRFILTVRLLVYWVRYFTIIAACRCLCLLLRLFWKLNRWSLRRVKGVMSFVVFIIIKHFLNLCSNLLFQWFLIFTYFYFH